MSLTLVVGPKSQDTELVCFYVLLQAIGQMVIMGPATLN